MGQKKNSDLFYEARDAVENESYLKAKTRTLRKYLAELSIVQPWESDQLCWHAVQRKHEWIQKINSEIQRRKDSRWASFHFYKRGIIIGIVATILGGVILFFVLQNARRQETRPRLVVLKYLPVRFTGQNNGKGFVATAFLICNKEKVQANDIDVRLRLLEHDTLRVEPEASSTVQGRTDSMKSGIKARDMRLTFRRLGSAKNIKIVVVSSLHDFDSYYNLFSDPKNTIRADGRNFSMAPIPNIDDVSADSAEVKMPAVFTKPKETTIAGQLSPVYDESCNE